jgi:hypothetical protein
VPHRLTIIRWAISTTAAALAAGSTVAALTDANFAARLNADLPYWAPITHRLAGHAPDAPDPGFHTQVPLRALRQVATLLPDRAQYEVVLPAAARAAEYTDIVSALRLYAPYAITTSSSAHARWAVVYGGGTPKGKRRPVGEGVLLVELAR